MSLEEARAEVSVPGKTLIRDKAKVEFDELGEGVDGDYNPDDPDDVELLRFDVSELVETEEDKECAEEWGYGLGWTPKRDSSYCCQLPVSLSTERRDKALQIIMDAVHDPIMDHNSVKRICERLSWMDESWIDAGGDPQTLAKAA